MILVDTSVWVAHLRRSNSKLYKLLDEAKVFAHPFVVGELACGNLRNRSIILADLEALPKPVLATQAEVMRLIEHRRLWGCGIGLIDVNLLASALLSDCELWSLDKKLAGAAGAAGVRLFR